MPARVKASTSTEVTFADVSLPHRLELRIRTRALGPLVMREDVGRDIENARSHCWGQHRFADYPLQSPGSPVRLRLSGYLCEREGGKLPVLSGVKANTTFRSGGFSMTTVRRPLQSPCHAGGYGTRERR